MGLRKLTSWKIFLAVQSINNQTYKFDATGRETTADIGWQSCRALCRFILSEHCVFQNVHGHTGLRAASSYRVYGLLVYESRLQVALNWSFSSFECQSVGVYISSSTLKMKESQLADFHSGGKCYRLIVIGNQAYPDNQHLCADCVEAATRPSELETAGGQELHPQCWRN